MKTSFAALALGLTALASAAQAACPTDLEAAAVAAAIVARQPVVAPAGEMSVEDGLCGRDKVLRFLAQTYGEAVGYKARLVDWARHDAPAVMELVAQRHPGLPITWFGHSMGGILFGMMPQHPRIDRVATLGSGSGYREHVARPLRYVMGVFWHVIVPLSVARHGYFAGRRIRTVDDLPRGVVAQWKRWCSHPDFVVSEGEAVRQAYASVKLPITAVVFTDDTMASPRGVKAMHSHYTGTQVDLKVLRPEQHGLRAVGHFQFFHPKTGSKGWSMSLPWLGLACA